MVPIATGLEVDVELFGVTHVMERHANKLYFTKSLEQVWLAQDQIHSTIDSSI